MTLLKFTLNYYLFSYIVITEANIWGKYEKLNHEQLINGIGIEIY